MGEHKLLRVPWTTRTLCPIIPNMYVCICSKSPGWLEPNTNFTTSREQGGLLVETTKSADSIQLQFMNQRL